jgi:hypothetical protein
MRIASIDGLSGSRADRQRELPRELTRRDLREHRAASDARATAHFFSYAFDSRRDSLMNDSNAGAICLSAISG